MRRVVNEASQIMRIPRAKSRHGECEPQKCSSWALPLRVVTPEGEARKAARQQPAA